MRLGSWNVRTMRTGFPDTSESSECVQQLRKTAVIDGELSRLQIEIAALQETRLPDEGSIREANYTFFWKGYHSSAPRLHGVGFAVRNELLRSTETPKGISERIMLLRFNTKCGFVTVVSAYAPTLKSSEESKDTFYQQLSEAIQKVPTGDRLILLGDFNARVGRDRSCWPDCLGEFGVGNQNENGQRLLEFCSRNQLCVTNTYFKGKFMRKVSWKHPRSGHWHQLDLVLTRRKDLKDTSHTRAFHGADCDTDHSLVVTTLRLTPKKIHSSQPRGKRRLNIPSTAGSEKIDLFSNLVTSETNTWDANASAADEWNRVKRLLTDTAARAFGYRHFPKVDWFDDNLHRLQPLLVAK